MPNGTIDESSWNEDQRHGFRRVINSDSSRTLVTLELWNTNEKIAWMTFDSNFTEKNSYDRYN